MPFLSVLPVMRNSIGSASLPSGPRSVSILSTWLCGCGLCRPIERQGSALSFGRDNKLIWQRHIANHTSRTDPHPRHFALSAASETQVWKVIKEHVIDSL